MTAQQPIPGDLAQRLIDCIDVERGLRRCAFDAARILRAHYDDPEYGVLVAARLLDSADVDIPEAWGDLELFLEEVYAAYSKVLLPDSSDPLRAAWEWAKVMPRPQLPGQWPPLKRTHKDAGRTLMLCIYLSQGGRRPFYLSCRSLAGLLECDTHRAAAILNMLVSNEVLEVEKAHTRTRARRFRVKPHREYRGYVYTENTKSMEAEKFSADTHFHE